MTLQNEQAAQGGLREEEGIVSPTAEGTGSGVRWEGGGTGASTASQRSFDILVRNKRRCEVLSKMEMLLKKENLALAGRMYWNRGN